MGWFSDALFGERKRIDQSKIDDMMAPTRNLINQQNELAQGMLDPNSEFSRRNASVMRTQYADAMAQQSQDMQATAAMRGVSPGQAMQMQKAAGASQMGQLGGALQQQQGQMYQQGLGLLGQVTGLEKGMNEQRVNTYMQQVNAHNQRRAANVGLATSLAGAAMGGFGNIGSAASKAAGQTNFQAFLTGAGNTMGGQ